MVVDNMITAVIERQGSLIRFNDAFLDFLRIFNMTPIACNVKSPHEKGKIENIIKYIRQNFWPLRTFSDLFDVNRQVRNWLDTVANVRIHQTTKERPSDRLAEVHLKPLPDLLPDCRETQTLKVYKDFAVRFDANVYTAPPWTIGKQITVKADPATVTLYYREKKSLFITAAIDGERESKPLLIKSRLKSSNENSGKIKTSPLSHPWDRKL